MTPYQFDEFFASGLSESVSPFLTPSSRKWSKNMPLKSAFIAAFFLALAFAFSFFLPVLSNLFLTLVFFLAGVPAILSAVEDFKNFEINIDLLMTLSAFISLFIGSGMEGALLLVLFELSGSLEESVGAKAKSAFTHLRVLSPAFAYVIDPDGNYFEKAVKEIPIGSKILVKSGEIVPLDGIVIEGSSSVNLFHLTGESLPKLKIPGDHVPAGARNLEAFFVLEVTRKSADSTLSRMIQLITQGAEAKPKVQRFLDRFGKKYSSLVILLTFLFMFILPFPFLGMEGSIYRALAFMIAASPCALIIGAPTAYLSAISSCARKGILLKGGVVLDALSQCKRFCFDKTGTLTTGKLRLLELIPIKTSFSPLLALGIAESLERHVTHPMAEAVEREAKRQGAPKVEVHSFTQKAGYGLQGTVELEGKKLSVFLGSSDFIKERVPADLFRPGEPYSLLLIGEHLFYLRFSDELRNDVKETIAKLYQMGLQPVIMTGDNLPNAQKTAKEIGIREYLAELKPEDKLNLIAKFSEEGGLAMIGDGINDAPALARATVGISLGKIASATAQDASDIILLNDDISLIPWLTQKAKKTMSIVKQNLFLALSIILLVTTPALLGLIPLWLAVLLHEGGTILVGLNSLRLLKSK